MSRYKKASNIIYLCSALNIYSNFMDPNSEKHISELKKYAKLKNISTFCENINKNDTTFEKSAIKTLKKFENEEQKNNNTSKEIQKNKINDNLLNKNMVNNNSIINDKVETVSYNYNDNFVGNEKDKYSIINETNEYFNETYSNKENKEIAKKSKKNDDQLNNLEMYNDEKNNEERNGNIKNVDKSKVELNEDMINFIQDVLKKHYIVLFMKGTALNPFCKYSRQAIHILKLNKVKEIYTVNILDDEKLRNSLKIYSDWPTFPQLYVNSKFVGGIDKVQELHDNNKLKELLENL